MPKTKKILAFIGARAGSKGFKDKNIADLAGKPLISWTVQAACQSECVDRTIVSTDGEAIAQAAKEAGADVPFLRPDHLAQDDSDINDAIVHCLDWIQSNENQTYDYILRLQPTTPLRSTYHIEKAIEFYFENRKSDQDTLVSVTKAPKQAAWIMQEGEKGYIDFCLPITQKQYQRQNIPDYYIPNGAIYFAPIEVFKHTGFYTPQTIAFVMENQASIDVDSEEDLNKIKKILEQENILLKEEV